MESGVCFSSASRTSLIDQSRIARNLDVPTLLLLLKEWERRSNFPLKTSLSHQTNYLTADTGNLFGGGVR